MEGVKPQMQIFCILTLIIGEMLTAAYMIEDPTVHADITDQANLLTDPLVILTKRLDELEQLRAKDVKELNLRVQELSEFRENDVRVLTGLYQEVDELKRLRANDLNRIRMMTERIEKLERQCESRDQGKYDNSMQTPIPPRDEMTLSNTSEVPLTSFNTPSLDDLSPNGEDFSTQLADTSDSETIRSQGQIQSRKRRKNTRASSSDDVVAFHAILSHTITDPSTNHVVVFDRLVTNSGGGHFSPNTGVFTCTQSGVHVFSWAIDVAARQFVYTDLVKNTAVIGSALIGEGSGYESAGSATSATHLNVGDEVWVRVGGHSGGADILSTRSMFTGFRLN